MLKPEQQLRKLLSSWWAVVQQQLPLTGCLGASQHCSKVNISICIASCRCCCCCHGGGCCLLCLSVACELHCRGSVRDCCLQQCFSTQHRVRSKTAAIPWVFDPWQGPEVAVPDGGLAAASSVAALCSQWSVSCSTIGSSSHTHWPGKKGQMSSTTSTSVPNCQWDHYTVALKAAHGRIHCCFSG